MNKDTLPSNFTILRYPGGKSKYIKRYLIDFIDGEFDRFIEPFAGGASFSLFLKKMFPDKQFWINDLNYNLICFWNTLRENGEEMYEKVTEYRRKYNESEQSRRELFTYMKNHINTYESEFDRGVAFYILNKTSFSGLTEQGNFTPQAWDSNFSERNIKKILEGKEYVKDFYITSLDYRDVFNSVGENDFLFLDPPYDINIYLYGKDGALHRGFDHKEFSSMVKSLPCKFLITYNDNEKIREWYKDFYIYDREFRYFMNHGTENKTRTKNELFISNVSPL